jgi:hypothetical protein
MRMMKIIKIMLIAWLSIISIATISCKKKDNKRRDFYLEQIRNNDVVGIYHLVNGGNTNNSIAEWDIRANGEIYKTSIDGDTRHGGKTPMYYWYTSDYQFYMLFYSKEWDKGSYEDIHDYWFSDTKDTLFLKPDSDHVVSAFVRQ